jgi:hypothetical protein
LVAYDVQTQPPAVFNACNVCDIIGIYVKVYGTTIYPGACRYLPVNDPLRAQYMATFAAWPELKALSNRPPPKARTNISIRTAMAEAEASSLPLTSVNHPWRYFGFKGRSVFAKHRPYFDCARMMFLDEVGVLDAFGFDVL